MKVLVGYETSGVVREAFRALGHDAWSCDILPSDDNSPYHFQSDIWSGPLEEEWDLGIFHPPCTYLTVSAAWAFTDGPYHQKVSPTTLVGKARCTARTESLREIELLMSLDYPWCIENPSPSFISSFIRKPDQVVQPYQFGEDASKKTGLWLNRLPPLVPTQRISGRVVNGKERWANQTDSGQNKLTPSETRWKDRSKTYEGIANAMAIQWSSYLLQQEQHHQHPQS